VNSGDKISKIFYTTHGVCKKGAIWLKTGRAISYILMKDYDDKQFFLIQKGKK